VDEAMFMVVQSVFSHYQDFPVEGYKPS